jgi:acyl carrier protein
MGAQLSEQDRERLRRTGITPLENKQALAMFDTSRTAVEPVVLALGLELSGLRTSGGGEVPSLLRGLVGAPKRHRHAGSEGSLARRLAGVPEGEREGVVLELVRAHAAAVLGHASPQELDGKAAFKDLGFDSLSAVELRNRLGDATGLKLPATLIFDYPTPATLAFYLLGEVEGTVTQNNPIDHELDRLEQLMASFESEGNREQVNTRLRSMVSRVQFLLNTTTGDQHDAETAGEETDLESASDDQLFELINKELGT